MVWEVKPQGKSGSKQVKKYCQEAGLEPGIDLGPISNIPLFGNYTMDIAFDGNGTANYSIHKLNEKGERVLVTLKEAKQEYAKRCLEAILATGVILGGTVVEDVFSGGWGAFDDPMCFEILTEIIRSLYSVESSLQP